MPYRWRSYTVPTPEPYRCSLVSFVNYLPTAYWLASNSTVGLTPRMGSEPPFRSRFPTLLVRQAYYGRVPLGVSSRQAQAS